MANLQLEIPEGMVIDVDNSDLSKGIIKLKKEGDELEWSDFGPVDGWYINSQAEIKQVICGSSKEDTKNIYPTKELAEAALALSQLLQWRNKVWKEDNNWTPDWNEAYVKYVICVNKNVLKKDFFAASQNILTFRTSEIRNKFLKQHRSLIEKAKILL